MNARQMDRAVNAALNRILPPMVRALRDDLVAALREELAAREEAPVVTQKAEPFWPISPMPAPAPSTPWTEGEGAGRRMTEAGLAELARLAGEGMSSQQIADQLGVTRRAVDKRLGARAEAGPSKAERDAARAAKVRDYQREWRRKTREAKAAVVGVDHASRPDVTVEAAVTVPALIVPAEAPAIVLPAPPARPVSNGNAGVAAWAKLPLDAATGRRIPNEPQPMDPAQLEPVPASYEDALDWLFAELTRQKMATAEIETRLAAMTTKQLLATCNAQRIKAGLSPYVLTERAA